MNKTIKIQLRPSDYYFFGGEETFSSGSSGVTNYHVKSNLLPQQTGLLGLLRHIMLQAGYQIGNSFNGQNNDFGCIEELSSLFIVDASGDILIPAPSSISHAQKSMQLQFNNEGKSFINGSWQQQVVEAPAYKAKELPSRNWLNLTSGVLIAEKGIFLQKDHIGINKAKRIEQQTDEDAFYKQQFVTLKAGYSFAFYAKIDDAIDIGTLSHQLPFGGEQRTFHISYENGVANVWDVLKQKAAAQIKPFLNNQSCIVLLSDAWVPELEKLKSNTQFAIMDETPFRNIITPANVKNYGSYTRNPGTDIDKIYKGKVLYLVKKTAIFFAEAERLTEVETLLTQPVFSKIGYNQFIKF